MSQPEDADQNATPSETQPATKKAYYKPQMRYERVFETRALTCGKVSVTQGQCVHNLKTS